MKYPLADQILEWRDIETDLNFLKSAAWAERVYPEWNVVSKTGRIHASNPAVQNVNKETCRPFMVPAEGCILLKADYKQMRMRLLANFSAVVAILHDAVWVEAPMEEALEAKRLLIESMRSAVEYPSVPLDVEVEWTEDIDGETA